MGNQISKFIMKSYLAGVSIAIGGTVFLASDNKLVGAILFSIGLFLVCTMRYYLFTGKVCYFGEYNIITLLAIWLLNFAGAFSIGILTRVSNPAVIEKAKIICGTKLQQQPLSTFLLAVMCNILIFFAVHEFSNNQHELGKYFAIVACVVVFIMSGFEHCVANMYYFSVAGWSIVSLEFLIVNTFGNAIGGILIYRLNEIVKNVK